MARSQRKDGAQRPGESSPADEVSAGARPLDTEAHVAAPGYAEPAPTERVYAIVFGRVWLAALAAVAAMGRWTVTASDPVRGEILVEVRGVMRKAVRPARIRIVLDGVGLTRIDAAFLTGSGEPAAVVEPRQIARFHRQVEKLLRRDSPA